MNRLKFLATIAVFFLFSTGFGVVKQSAVQSDTTVVSYLMENRPLPVHEDEIIERMPMPEHVRSIYITASTFASSRGDELVEALLDSGGNAIVVDAQFGGGRLAFEPKNSFLKNLNPGSTLLNDFPEKIKALHDKGVYVIARHVVFKQPYMTSRQSEWRIKNRWGGLYDANWTDPSKAAVQNYNLYVLQELAELGFDEVQFDYIRFPAANHSSLDYNYDESKFTRVDVINEFLSKARKIADYYDLKISADVFGVIVWGDIDWRIVGQDPHTIVDYVDALYPMTYPSHYSPGFYQHPDPWNKPYNIIYNSIKRFVDAAEGRAHIRTWIQGFPLKVSYFGTWYMEEQIKASFDAGATGFAVWSPGNHYGYTFPALAVKGAEKGCEMDKNWHCITYDISYKNQGPKNPRVSQVDPSSSTPISPLSSVDSNDAEEPDWLR